MNNPPAWGSPPPPKPARQKSVGSKRVGCLPLIGGAVAVLFLFATCGGGSSGGSAGTAQPANLYDTSTAPAPAPAPTTAKVKHKAKATHAPTATRRPRPTRRPTHTTAPRRTHAATVHPGAFCSPAGAHGVAANGHTYTCKGPDQNRWRR